MLCSRLLQACADNLCLYVSAVLCHALQVPLQLHPLVQATQLPPPLALLLPPPQVQPPPLLLLLVSHPLILVL